MFYLNQQLYPPKIDEIKCLDLYLDNGIYHSRGRILNIFCKEKTKFSIWLPAKSRLTELFIYSAHLTMLRTGSISVLNHIKLTCWIPQSDRTVRHAIWKNCHSCRKLDVCLASRPAIFTLPAERVQPSSVFSHTGVDYFELLLVKDSVKI